MAVSIIKTTCTDLIRRKNSVNGGPSYTVKTTDGDFTTAEDSMVAYAISTTLIGEEISITVNSRRQIINMDAPILSSNN